MITHARAPHMPVPRWEHQHDFDYSPAPHAGLSSLFAWETLLGLIIWSSAAASMAFWVWLLAAAMG